MEPTVFHARMLAKALGILLGEPQRGAMAFVRCLAPDVIERLGADDTFAPGGWEVLRVADESDASTRTVTADQAVERRESKGDAAVLLVDTERAGAGMDGIFSASREMNEATLFDKACQLAFKEIRQRHSAERRRYAASAIKRARGLGGPHGVSRWAEFDYLCRVADDGSPGAHLHLLGLWPVVDVGKPNDSDVLSTSRNFVERLLSAASSSLPPAERIDTLRLDPSSERQTGDLERFLNDVDAKPLPTALLELATREHLWIGALRTERPADSILGIELTSWRNRNGSIARWSGLIDDSDDEAPPILLLTSEAARRGRETPLMVKWKSIPTDLEKNAVTYRVSVRTDMDEELASREVSHSALRGGEKCRFGDDDFSFLDEDALLSAKVMVEVVGNDGVESKESEEFRIRFGEPPAQVTAGVGKKVRTFSEGVADVGNREVVREVAAFPEIEFDSKGFALLRTPVHEGTRRSFRVFRPSLIEEVEQQWIDNEGMIGRWTVKVRATGQRAAPPMFEPIEDDAGSAWMRARSASRKMAERFRTGGGVAQIYDDEVGFDTVQEYLRAWATLLEQGDSQVVLANTVEVRSLGDRTLGLIVLPSHPLRVAWHAAYDNLVFDTAFRQEQDNRDIGKELAVLDGAMFPAFLPNPCGGAFVFADTLGFHAIGMVPDTDKEPKAAVAMLASALANGDAPDIAPTAGSQSSGVLREEIVKYLRCHTRPDAHGKPDDAPRMLHIHALRAGDGLTVARSLGGVDKHYRRRDETEAEDGNQPADAPVFCLDLYPSEAQRGVAGRFIADAREKRRSRAGVLAAEDRWMLESLGLPGNVTMPRLRWARKENPDPKTAAHMAVAFDTFESHVVPANDAEPARAPYHAFGLLSFWERKYSSRPYPMWTSAVPLGFSGEKHPSRRAHTEMLARLQRAIYRLVARHLGESSGSPVLKTEITRDKADSLMDLHRLCDWVVTLDRNAGVEYFDSPNDNPEIYDAYVIDCVPEREDLGCLQLITSTTNLDEVRNLLDGALDHMGLSRSRRNAEFLLKHLKALSGRLAIRLTGQRPATSELIALAVSHANCEHASADDYCWVSLESGFIVPVDDVTDLLPPLSKDKSDDEKETRPDLIYVTTAPRRGLLFKFVEVKYRRHLRTARSPDLLDRIYQQTRGLRQRWDRWYDHDNICSTFRSVRRAKLARVLRFYADKASRHFLPPERHRELVAEIDRMIEDGASYSFAVTEAEDRGWVFCPEYAGHTPLRISPGDWSTQIFLFGPGLLPDTDYRSEKTDPDPIRRHSVSPPARPDARHSVTSEHLSSNRTDNPSVAPDSRTDSTEPPEPSVLLGTATHTDKEVAWRPGVKRNPHLLIAGLPGMGKTTCLVNLCRQLATSSVAPIVFSYHADIDEALEDTLGEVRFLDFDGLGFNPLQVIDQEARMAHLDIAGAMRDIFTAIYTDLGDIQADRIRTSIKESFVEAGWGPDTTAPEPDFRRFLEILRDDARPDRGLRTLLARLGELDDYGFFHTAADSRGSLWESELPTVIRIHTTQNANLQRAFAFLVFYGLYKDMFRRGIQKRITHALVFDEAHRASRLKLIPTMAKECRKYGISLVLASQEARDFDVSVFSAIANYLVLRSTDTDARFLVRNVSNSRQERSLIDRIKQMERFKALYFAEGRSRPVQITLSEPP